VKVLILTALLLLSGCYLSPEQRANLSAGSYAAGRIMQQEAYNQQAIADRWQNYRFQQQQIFQQQQTNQLLLQQQMNRRY